MGFSVKGAIGGGLSGIAGGPAGIAAGAALGGFLGGDTSASFNAPAFVPIEGIDQVAPVNTLQQQGSIGLTPQQQAGQVGALGTGFNFNPGGVQTGNAGVTVGPNGELISALGGQGQVSQQQLFGLGSGFLNEASTFNPDEFGANVSDRLRAAAAPQEERDRLALENRLQSQGLLSSTVGGDRFESLFAAQALAENQRVAQGFSLGQDVQGNLLNRGSAAINQGFGLDALGSNLFGTSLAGAQGGLQAQQLGLNAGIANQGAQGVNAGNVLSQNRLNLQGDQLGINQQDSRFRNDLAAQGQAFDSRIASGNLEIKNQLAQQGNINAFNISNAKSEFGANQDRADANAGFLSGAIGALGSFTGSGGGDLASSFTDFFGGGSSVDELASDPFLDASSAGNQDFSF